MFGYRTLNAAESANLLAQRKATEIQDLNYSDHSCCVMFRDNTNLRYILSGIPPPQYCLSFGYERRGHVASVWHAPSIAPGTNTNMSTFVLSHEDLTPKQKALDIDDFFPKDISALIAGYQRPNAIGVVADVVSRLVEQEIENKEPWPTKQNWNLAKKRGRAAASRAIARPLRLFSKSQSLVWPYFGPLLD
jgi:hypothetical protein